MEAEKVVVTVEIYAKIRKMHLAGMSQGAVSFSHHVFSWDIRYHIFYFRVSFLIFEAITLFRNTKMPTVIAS